MSELKAKHVIDVYDEYSSNPYNEAQVYLKSEADKVIDELNVKLKVQISVTEDAWKLKDAYHTSYAEAVAELYEVRKDRNHEKYKRCLAMAQQLFNERTYWHYRYDDWGDRGYDRKYKWGKVKWCGKWGRKWLAIAEKFKDGV